MDRFTRLGNPAFEWHKVLVMAGEWTGNIGYGAHYEMMGT